MANNNQDEHFCQSQLLIEAKQATLFELLLLLFSSDIRSRRFIHCPEDQRHRDFNRRCLIFISTLTQLLLISCREPLALLGNSLDMLLNLITNNGGVFKLLFNFIKGKDVWPDRSSAEFTSFLGNLDTRVELDSEIRPGHRRYNATLSLMAAKVAYENEFFIKSVVNHHWKMEFLCFNGFWNEYQQRASTQAFMFQDTNSNPNLIVVAFRGTRPFDADAWCTDVDVSWYELPGIGKIHRGFMKALGMQKNGWPNQIEGGNNAHLYAYYAIKEKLREELVKNENSKFIITGHSLGGALAILFMAVLAIHEEAWFLERLEGVYTFGQPRVGDDRQFGEFMADKLMKYDVKYMRFIYCNDMKPRLPYDDKTTLFKHFGPCLYFNSFYRGKVVVELPNKNYFSLWWALPKILNAAWELIRSFILPLVKGKEYREGWAMILLRIVGIVIPGLSAHATQDYDNCTRLGSLPSLSVPQIYQQELHQD